MSFRTNVRNLIFAVNVNRPCCFAPLNDNGYVIENRLKVDVIPSQKDGEESPSLNDPMTRFHALLGMTRALVGGKAFPEACAFRDKPI